MLTVGVCVSAVTSPPLTALLSLTSHAISDAEGKDDLIAVLEAQLKLQDHMTSARKGKEGEGLSVRLNFFLLLVMRHTKSLLNSTPFPLTPCAHFHFLHPPKGDTASAKALAEIAKAGRLAQQGPQLSVNAGSPTAAASPELGVNAAAAVGSIVATGGGLRRGSGVGLPAASGVGGSADRLYPGHVGTPGGRSSASDDSSEVSSQEGEEGEGAGAGGAFAGAAFGNSVCGDDANGAGHAVQEGEGCGGASSLAEGGSTATSSAPTTTATATEEGNNNCAGDETATTSLEAGSAPNSCDDDAAAVSSSAPCETAPVSQDSLPVDASIPAVDGAVAGPGRLSLSRGAAADSVIVNGKKIRMLDGLGGVHRLGEYSIIRVVQWERTVVHNSVRGSEQQSTHANLLTGGGSAHLTCFTRR